MQAAVKTPHTEIRISGKISERLLKVLKDEYGEKLSVTDDEKPVDVFSTDWYSSVKSATSPGDVLRHFRQMHGYTQAELGQVLGGIPRQHISNMERGRRQISLVMARRLGQVFSVAADRFLAL